MTREEAIEWMDWLKMDVRERGYNDIVAALNMAIKALEQEPILDKIRAEIEKDAIKDVNGSKYIFVNRVNQIIDKYKAESEG